MDFLLVIIELFSLGATADTLRANIDWKSPFLMGWVSWPNISGRRGRTPPTIPRVEKLDGIRMSAELSFVLSQFTRLTDRQTALRSPKTRCIQCSALMSVH